MDRHIHTAAATLLLALSFAAPAHAGDGNSSSIDQITLGGGAANNAFIDQKAGVGHTNTSGIYQNGNGNTVGTGSGDAGVEQVGTSTNTSYIYQGADGAPASNNDVRVTQDGANNTSYSYINQQSSSNHATVTQGDGDGAGNNTSTSYVYQNGGDNNTATATQGGTGNTNYSYVNQQGPGNNATVTQGNGEGTGGNGNTSYIYQGPGDSNVAATAQTGSGNTNYSHVNQQSSGNHATATQHDGDGLGGEHRYVLHPSERRRLQHRDRRSERNRGDQLFQYFARWRRRLYG